MTYIQKPGRSGAGRFLLAAALVALAGARGVRAQDFERTFGREKDEIGKTTQMTADGGYIAAGYTQDPATLETRAYVVRMNAVGGTVWERRFKVGGGTQTFGMDLKQLAGGDHILVGSAGTPSAGCVGCAHIYAVRFTDAGDLVWYRTYGDAQSNQYATSVVETQVAISSPDDVGNLVVAGYTDDGTGKTRGILMRLWSTGEIRWASTYDPNPAGSPHDEQLMSLDEVRAGSGLGDIVATGFATFAATRYDVWLLRVDGLSGRINAAPQGSSTFASGADDRGYSIQELRLGAHPGDLVIAGESFGRAGTTNSEILMLQARPDPCDPAGQRADQYTGDGARDPNFARCVREITDGHLGKVGDVVVTGTSFTTAFGPSLDLFMQQYTEGTMVPATLHFLYGGTRDDGGNGIGVVTGNLGFIATGYVTSNPPAPFGHLSDLYVVRTDIAMRSCTEKSVKLSSQIAKLKRTCNVPTLTTPAWTVLCAVDASPLGWEFDLCR